MNQTASVLYRLGVAVCLMVAPLSSSHALAQAEAALNLDSNSGPPGSEVTANGSGFDCAEDAGTLIGPIEIRWEEERTLVESETDRFGGFSVPFTVPSDSPAGERVVTARCTNTDWIASENYIVEGAAQEPSPEPFVVPSPESTVAPSPNVQPTVPPLPPDVDQPPRPNHRSSFPMSIASPSEVPLGLRRLLTSVVLTGLLVLLVGFPAEIFNETLRENYDEIRRYLGWIPAGAFDRLRVPSWAKFAVFCVIAAALLSLVDPKAAVNQETIVLAVGLMIAVAVTTLSYSWPREAYQRRVSGLVAELHTLPGALIVAGLLALLSRAAHFEPGYVYGLIAGYALVRRKLSPIDEGRAVLLGAVCTLGFSLVAWFAWVPIDRAAEAANPNLAILIADATLAGVFVIGVDSVLFGLMPFRFLDGLKLATWSRIAWGVVYGTAAFGFVHVHFARQAEDPVDLTRGAVIRMVALFVGFGAFSLLFWAFFTFRSIPPSDNGRGL